MSKERLEEIRKSTWVHVHLGKETTAELPKRHFEYLYQQAELVEDNNQAIVDLNKHVEELEDENIDLKEQNKRYREQLELIREDTFATEEDEVYVSIKHLIRKRVDKALERDCIHCNGKGFNGLDYCSQCNQGKEMQLEHQNERYREAIEKAKCELESEEDIITCARNAHVTLSKSIGG